MKQNKTKHHHFYALHYKKKQQANKIHLKKKTKFVLANTK